MLITSIVSYGEKQSADSCQITRMGEGEEGGGGGNALTVFWIAQDARGWSKYHGINVERKDQCP